MAITRTVLADRRYYLDEGKILNQGSILDTLSRFNDMKIWAYNLLYDIRFLGKDLPASKNCNALMKERLHENDYYNSAVYTAASGTLSSQRELKDLYIKGKLKDLEARDEKIRSLEHALENKKKLKASILAYLKTGAWEEPYRLCRFHAEKGMMYLPGGKSCPVTEFEFRLDEEIRSLKTRTALVKEARKRAAGKLEALMSHPPRRVVFGTRRKYREKDAEGVDMDAWKQEYHDARHASMSLPGRHTSKDCNFLVHRTPVGLAVRCMDGKEAVFTEFHLSRYHEVWEAMLSAKKAERKSICYNFTLRRDRDGRAYFLVSVTLELENPECRECYENGWVSMDINYDHVALTDVDRDGKRICSTVIRFDVEGKTSGQVSDTIGRVMAKAGKYCADRQKPLIMEDIDTTISRNGMRYGDRKRNLHASLFAYRKMTSSIENQAYKQGVWILKTNPAYTSQIGKFLYMKPYGISIHEAASYVVGLKGIGLLDALVPDAGMAALLPEKIRKKLAAGPDMETLMKAWKKITDAFKGVPVHEFFRGIPYDALENETNRRKKRKTLKMLANEMKLRAGIPEE